METTKKMLEWRARQKRGSIMKPRTFVNIETAAKKKYHVSDERAAKIAGKAYWTSVSKSYKEYLKAKHRK